MDSMLLPSWLEQNARPFFFLPTLFKWTKQTNPRVGLHLHAISVIPTAANQNGYLWVAECCCRCSKFD